MLVRGGAVSCLWQGARREKQRRCADLLPETGGSKPGDALQALWWQSEKHDGSVADGEFTGGNPKVQERSAL
jgi:hypothetical protein